MKIFSVGEASYDITVPLATYPKENTKTYVGKKIECGGGTASNVAVLLSDWKEKSYFVGAIGNDYYGKKVSDSLFLHNVDTRYLSIINDANTTTTNIINSLDKQTKTQIIFKDQNLYCEKTNFLFNNPDVIFFDGNEIKTALKLINIKKQAIKIYGTNDKVEETVILSPYMDYVILSSYVAKKISRINFKNDDKVELKKACQILEERLKNKNIIITLSEYGSFAKVNGIYQIIPSIKVKPLDQVAAGDIYFASFTYFITHDYDLKKAMKLANIAGAISTTRIGGRFSIPSKEEVLSYDR